MVSITTKLCTLNIGSKDLWETLINDVLYYLHYIKLYSYWIDYHNSITISFAKFVYHWLI